MGAVQLPERKESRPLIALYNFRILLLRPKLCVFDITKLSCND